MSSEVALPLRKGVRATNGPRWILDAELEAVVGLGLDLLSLSYGAEDRLIPGDSFTGVCISTSGTVTVVDCVPLLPGPPPPPPPP